MAGESAAVCRIIVFSHALQAGLVELIYSWGSMGCYTADTFACLTRRPAPSETGPGDGRAGACAYGPDWAQLAAVIADWGWAWR
jgi:protein-L-isoaspartate(D-aspartate) O-methyltransferase